MNKRIIQWFDHAVAATSLRGFLQNPKRILKKYVRPGLTVLDVGAGEGYFSLAMARMVGSRGRVMAVDLQAEKLDLLRARAVEAGMGEGIETRVCTERSLNIDDYAGWFDFALACYVVHHAADVEALMGEVYKALKPGGEFFIIEPGHHASPKEIDAIEAAAQRAGFMIIDRRRLISNRGILLGKS